MIYYLLFIIFIYLLALIILLQSIIRNGSYRTMLELILWHCGHKCFIIIYTFNLCQGWMVQFPEGRGRDVRVEIGTDLNT